MEDRDPNFPLGTVRNNDLLLPQPSYLVPAQLEESGRGEKAVSGSKTPALPHPPSQGQGQEGGVGRAWEGSQRASRVTGGSQCRGGAGPHFGSLGSNRSQWPHQRGGHEMGHVACSFLWGKCSPLMPRASPPSPKRRGHASHSLHHCFVPSDTPGKAGRRTAVGLQPPGHSCGTCPCRLKAPHP